MVRAKPSRPQIDSDSMLGVDVRTVTGIHRNTLRRMDSGKGIYAKCTLRPYTKIGKHKVYKISVVRDAVVADGLNFEEQMKKLQARRSKDNDQDDGDEEDEDSEDDPKQYSRERALRALEIRVNEKRDKYERRKLELDVRERTLKAREAALEAGKRDFDGMKRQFLAARDAETSKADPSANKEVSDKLSRAADKIDDGDQGKCSTAREIVSQTPPPQIKVSAVHKTRRRVFYCCVHGGLRIRTHGMSLLDPETSCSEIGRIVKKHHPDCECFIDVACCAGVTRRRFEAMIKVCDNMEIYEIMVVHRDNLSHIDEEDYYHAMANRVGRTVRIVTVDPLSGLGRELFWRMILDGPVTSRTFLLEPPSAQ